jgi:essential nuclear protein 1
MPRAGKPVKQRHDPLHADVEQDDALRKYGRVTKPGKRKTKQEDEDGENVSGIFPRMSSTEDAAVLNMPESRGCANK